ncbi:copper radical oxidase [Panus rudis PR-1116 ss-1]|nr:copper radical oxidase [Panus rudis PR-1116 ss-1]
MGFFRTSLLCAVLFASTHVFASDSDTGLVPSNTHEPGYTSWDVDEPPLPSPKVTGLPKNWAYQGCFQEGPNAARVFPYEITMLNNATVDACLNQCQKYGYPAAGLESGTQCFCGDISNMNQTSQGPVVPAQCGLACSGDKKHICGGFLRLSYYTYNGTLDLWHKPDNIGRYEFLIGGKTAPLLATVGLNGKVNFLEKWGTDPTWGDAYKNSTGAYELDLSLVDDFDHAWRELHVKTDIFCSGSVVLPDKAGRQINVGGWAPSSTFGVRLYWPDGSPGVNGTNDWEENVDELSLQRGRWYPTVMTMTNGSLLVVGGEVSNKSVEEPTLEILPAPHGGPTFLKMDWLERTGPNNLYPFLHVLPSGNIFAGYLNEARILNPVTFDTIKALPNMPGSVASDRAGRTYPMEGSAVLLPQHAPYKDPIEVLVCGGSDYGIALDNCVSIAPEAPKATWAIERMPSKRVMPCMVALPDGTFLIVNGGQQGTAGFGMGDIPNLQALLYDPSQPLHQRMSILNTTIVPRMYHSEATLLPDGRVLVSGSDPLTNYTNGTIKFPEETRIEVYIPPYLNEGRTQPSFNISQNDWEYGGSYPINVTLHHGTTKDMRVSLIAATSSTHGNIMNGRTIFPAFKCNGNVCKITAPPNAKISPPGWHQLFILDGPTPSVSKWVRIGGDPARLGEWPKAPGFSLPGV